MVDLVSMSIKGTVIVERYIKGKLVETQKDTNLIVTNAREIVRDAIFGKRTKNVDGNDTLVDAPKLAYLVMGDGNQLAGEINIGQPSVDDKVLINPTLWVPIGATDEYPNNTVEAVDFNGRKSITYTFSISEKQGNTTSGFFCELGLALDKTQYPDAYLFSRMTKTQPINKTSDDSIILKYILSF